MPNFPEAELTPEQMAVINDTLFSDRIVTLNDEMRVNSAVKYVDQFSYRVLDSKLLALASIADDNVKLSCLDIAKSYGVDPRIHELLDRVNYLQYLRQNNSSAPLAYPSIRYISLQTIGEYEERIKRNGRFWPPKGEEVFTFEEPFFHFKEKNMIVQYSHPDVAVALRGDLQTMTKADAMTGDSFRLTNSRRIGVIYSRINKAGSSI